MATISERIKEALEINNMKQADLIKKTGINKGALSSYISGKYEPKQNNIYLMAKALNVSEAWLMGMDVPIYRVVYSDKKAICIPVLGRVAAGIPIDAIENIIDYEEISESMATIGDLFALKIKGNSMIPGIKDGDIVIVKKQSTADHNQIVIATTNGDDAVCKRFFHYGNTVLLHSDNPEYEDIDVTGREDFQIWGVVIELRRKF